MDPVTRTMPLTLTMSPGMQLSTDNNNNNYKTIKATIKKHYMQKMYCNSKNC